MKTKMSPIVQEFQSFAMKHDLQQSAHDEVVWNLESCPNISFVMLSGPTGIGKSTLLQKIVAQVVNEYRDEMLANPGVVPIIFTTAVAAGHRSFDWKRLYRDALFALEDPFVELRPFGRGAQRKGMRLPGETATGAELRMDLEAVMKMRGCVFWIIDEIQHILMGGRTGTPGDQFDVLKSISQSTKIKIVCAGTYQLASLSRLSGQLIRRSASVHLRRYRDDVAEEVNLFANCLNALLERLPLKGFPSVTDNFDYYYACTLGSVGLAKDWFSRAYSWMLKCGDEAIEMKHLEKTVTPASSLADMAREMLKGERLFSNDSLDVVRALLRGEKQEAAKKDASPKSKRKPGTRNPKRDPVGSRERE